MAGRLFRKLWQVLNTDIELSETLTGGVEAGRSVLELGDALQKNQNLKELKPIFDKIDSVIDALNLPLGEVVQKRASFLPIATSILKYVVEQTGRELTLPDSVELVSLAAYLESLGKFLRDRPEIQLQEKEASAEQARYIQKFAKKIKFDDNRARETLTCFHESLLARELNKALQARLVESGLAADVAATVTERVSRSTHRYMKEAVAAVKDDAQQLAGIYEDGWERDWERYKNIDKYLRDVIAKKPTEKVFDHEEFTFQDIYVPLEVRPFDSNEGADRLAAPENIEDWAKRILLDEGKSDRLLFVRASPRRGKSVFCRMFADLVRRELHPIYTPILIPLRDFNTKHANIEKMLSAAVASDFATRDNSWLRDCNTRFLFLLDGFDELLLEPGASYDRFLEKLVSFQKESADNKWGHRLLMTGKPLSRFGIIEELMLQKLERVSIENMSESIQQQWFEKWEILADTNAAKTEQLRELLRIESPLVRRVKELAREPFLLYVLAVVFQGRRTVLEKFLGAANLSDADLSNANLSGVKLSDVNLRNAELGDANLRDAKLFAAKLIHANLTGADLSDADLVCADLSNANLSGANLRSVRLIAANLSGANLSNAVLRYADFEKANLSGADLINTNCNGMCLCRVNLSNANLSGANLSSVRLIAANLTGANLTGANLSGANDRICSKNANLSGANFSGANFSGANLSNANFDNVDFTGANLNNVDFAGANLSGANLNGANLNGANLSGANLSGVNLNNADLRYANLSVANLNGAKLSDVQWNHNTIWSYAVELHKAIGAPEALKQEPEFAAAVVFSRR